MPFNALQSEARGQRPAIVLVHGAFRGGWSWQKVVDILHRQGHEVFAPSLTGAGEKAHLLTPAITLKTWTDDIVKVLNHNELDDVVLVGHSQGGIVIQSVAEATPERVSRLIFIDAPVLRDGEAAIDVVPEEVRKRFGDTPANSIIQPIPIVPDEYFSAEDAEWFNERLTAVPTNPAFETLRLTARADIPETYVFCSRTPPFFPSSFVRRRFDDEGVHYRLIDAPHDCIWTHPEIVASIICEAVA